MQLTGQPCTTDEFKKGSNVLIGLSVTAAALQFISTTVLIVFSLICHASVIKGAWISLAPSIVSVGLHIGAAIAMSTQLNCLNMMKNSSVGYAAILLFVGAAFGCASVAVHLLRSLTCCCGGRSTRPGDVEPMVSSNYRYAEAS